MLRVHCISDTTSGLKLLSLEAKTVLELPNTIRYRSHVQHVHGPDNYLKANDSIYIGFMYNAVNICRASWAGAHSDLRGNHIPVEAPVPASVQGQRL